ncbi:DUF881 domain-containing protein [Geodermatophilus sp. YIM 151500]|uniref:DUF881 domain-containing protein n=1 Tax=Geodermatophilus sp. YIM 151500 TaxID=2984531 RepID=UPI0021E45273|nr:DUF881 domain-containing protein [Geodermatophilus sp. YIM 151500]MCV2487974.1 DUF881 domain-containing protein [Geodermatophilus sp. YIM 151500]
MSEPTADRPGAEAAPGSAAHAAARRRRRLVSAVATGALTVALGFGLTVQIRSTGAAETVQGQREDDLIRILDEQDGQEEQLRQQLAEQRRLVEELSSGRERSGAALTQAQQRADAIAILNGTAPARGPGLRVTIRDPEGAVGPGILLDAVQELRGAGAEAIQVDGVRVVVSSHVGGGPGALSLDGQPLESPYDLRAVGPPEGLTVALNVPGGVVADVTRAGGSATVTEVDEVVVDATVRRTG